MEDLNPTVASSEVGETEAAPPGKLSCSSILMSVPETQERSSAPCEERRLTEQNN